MKAVVVEEVGSFTIKDIDIPKPGPGDVLLRVNVTGLCRTDLKLIRTGHRDLILPRVPGEEVVGIRQANATASGKAWKWVVHRSKATMPLKSSDSGRLVRTHRVARDFKGSNRCWKKRQPYSKITLDFPLCS